MGSHSRDMNNSSYCGERGTDIEGVIRKVLKDFVEHDLKDIIKEHVVAALTELEESDRFLAKTSKRATQSKGMLYKRKESRHEAETSGFGNKVVPSKQQRRFTDLNMSVSRVFEKLKKEGLIIPFEARNQPLQPTTDTSTFCHYHQVHGHSTDTCRGLRHKIQDLIDSGRLTDPKIVKPNIKDNPVATRDRFCPHCHQLF